MFLGSSKITPKLRVSIVQDAAKVLNVKDGDHILFHKDDVGNMVIKKG